MSDLESADWSESAASNNATPPDGWPEGMAPSSVNDAAREMMGALKRDWNRSHTTVSTAGTATAYTVTHTTAPVALVHGLRCAAKIHTDCGAAPTLNWNSLGAKAIKKMTAAGLENLVANDLQADHHAIFEYDSALDAFVLLSPTLVATFPAGTVMLFRQATAPTGWTKDTANNDAALRIVSGTPGSGGATGFSAVFGAGKATGGHTLSIAEMPLHGHPFRISTDGGNVSNFGGLAVDHESVSNRSAYTGTPTNTVGQQIGGEGGGGAHNHTLSLDLQYVDVIAAVKD